MTMERCGNMETKKANFFTNFKGNALPMLGDIVGPTTFGQFMVVVSADYDKLANTTRTGYCPATPEDVERNMKAHA